MSRLRHNHVYGGFLFLNDMVFDINIGLQKRWIRMLAF